ncbi:MAG TPA: WbqC family protein, partial [Arenimonas sp.]|nr:WbqC family protein [Arenimonas sp.]
CASRFEIDPALRGEQRIIELCRRIGATQYINPVGGLDIYHGRAFAAAGIRLSFLRTRCEPRTIGDEYVHLSILHDLIVDGIDACRERLPNFELVPPRAEETADA